MDCLRSNDIKNFKKALRGFTVQSLEQTTFKNDCEITEEYNIMQYSIIYGRCDFVHALLDINVDPNVGNGHEKPLLLAAKYGCYKILEVFMNSTGKSQSANENARQHRICFNQFNLEGENVLHLGKYL